MSAFNAITYAKAELMASVDSLDASQQFQILFYNEAPRFLSPNGRDMPAATEANRDQARRFLSEVQVAGGTDHMPALRAALALRPDVLYFLTDAGVPIIRAGDLEEIQQINQGATRIHCVEFGRGPELLLESSLRKLARQNGGIYRYRDVTRFNEE
jgi:Ca-activated chloride channel family protein